MRIVAGEAKGRLIRAPAGRGTRPTSDRVREAMFSVLGSLAAAGETPAIEDATVIDLFAGSGALGLEALSRGAAHATFVDADAGAVTTIRRNLDELGVTATRATVVRAYAIRWLRSGTVSGPVDVVLCDPPYSFEGWSELADLLAPVARTVLVESSAPPALGANWEILREKRYGGTVVLVARPERSPEPACDRGGDS